ncbi:MAG: hypothetical protein GY830_09495 [Bacteroidetes bacterium]|nr:hypothetical protein [Bacteroidota bacterium]
MNNIKTLYSYILIIVLLLSCSYNKERFMMQNSNCNWDCEACTFTNTPKSETCIMCTTERNYPKPKKIKKKKKQIENEIDLNIYQKLLNMGYEDKLSLDAAQKFPNDLNKAINFINEEADFNSVDNNWICHQCTLVNEIKNKNCIVCNQPQNNNENINECFYEQKEIQNGPINNENQYYIEIDNNYNSIPNKKEGKINKVEEKGNYNGYINDENCPDMDISDNNDQIKSWKCNYCNLINPFEESVCRKCQYNEENDENNIFINNQYLNNIENEQKQNIIYTIPIKNLSGQSNDENSDSDSDNDSESKSNESDDKNNIKKINVSLLKMNKFKNWNFISHLDEFINVSKDLIKQPQNLTYPIESIIKVFKILKIKCDYNEFIQNCFNFNNINKRDLKHDNNSDLKITFSFGDLTFNIDTNKKFNQNNLSFQNLVLSINNNYLSNQKYKAILINKEEFYDYKKEIDKCIRKKIVIIPYLSKDKDFCIICGGTSSDINKREYYEYLILKNDQEFYTYTSDQLKESTINKSKSSINIMPFSQSNLRLEKYNMIEFIER